MRETCGTRQSIGRHGERGGSRVKFLLVMALIIVVGYVGFQYGRVAFQAYQFKDLMQEEVDKAVGTGKTGDWVKTQLKDNAKDYGVPEDASYTAVENNNRMQARVQFKRQIIFPGYTYEYNFDHTVKSIDALTLR